MRIRIVLPLVAIVLVLGFIVHRLLAFRQLFYEHAGIAITQDEIAEAYDRQTPSTRPQYIPKIIHNVYHNWKSDNDSVPTDWDGIKQNCMSLNEDWKFMMWNKKSSREFIETNYPWFLATYDGYTFPIQRVDAVRYFILRYYGGIYMDMDNGCLRNLDALLYYPMWTTDGGRGALSNNILAAVPNHPFWELLTDSLIPYNYNYFFPYVTISFASGQWFETAIWEKYHAALPRIKEEGAPENRLYRIMMDDRPGTDPWIYFTQERGGTWVNWDNAFFLWIGDHKLLLSLGFLALFVLSVWGCLRCYNGKRRGYAQVKREEDV